MIVHEHENALTELDSTFAVIGQNSERPFGHFFRDIGEYILRQREYHGDRLQLRNDDKAGRVRRANDVTFVDHVYRFDR